VRQRKNCITDANTVGFISVSRIFMKLHFCKPYAAPATLRFTVPHPRSSVIRKSTIYNVLPSDRPYHFPADGVNEFQPVLSTFLGLFACNSARSPRNATEHTWISRTSVKRPTLYLTRHTQWNFDHSTFLSDLDLQRDVHRNCAFREKQRCDSDTVLSGVNTVPAVLHTFII
jgi:hypothetical protein